MTLQDRFKRKGVKEQLEPVLDATGISWGNYTHHRDDVTAELARDKKVIIPFSPHYIKNPYSWQAHSIIRQLNKLDADNQVMIIPVGSKLFRQSPSKTTLKKGALMPVRFHKKENLDLKAAFAERMKEVPQERFYYGWDFEGVNYSTQQFRTVLLYDHVRAQIVKDIFNKGEMSVKPYCDYRPAKGILVVKNMPSFETGEVYDDFVIEGVVLDELAKIKPERTFELSAGHSCYKTTYAKLKFGRDYYGINGDIIEAGKGGNTGREGREDAIDHHVILAMHIAEDGLAKQGVNIYNPFVIANDATVTLFDKLHNNVLIDTYDGAKITRGPLDIAHIETMLWNSIAYENSPSTKKMRAKNKEK